MTWSDSVDVPFPNYGATVLADQAQFDPMEALGGSSSSCGSTAARCIRVGGFARSHSPAEPRRSWTTASTVRAEHVVLATGYTDPGQGPVLLEARTATVLCPGLRGATAPEGMYLSAGSDSRSVRDAPDGAGGARLLVGGAGHSVGRTRSEAAHVERLRRWTEQYFPGAVETHQWSAQDYRSHDSVPYVGPLPRGLGRIYVATGFDKWGMTNGVAAARSISGQILGKKPSWAKTLGRRLTGPTAAGHLAAINIKVGLGAVGGAAEMVRRDGADGVLPFCSHLGGPLHWNDCEQSWDCPLHGSRFAEDGQVLEGPATRPLKRGASRRSGRAASSGPSCGLRRVSTR